MFIHSAWAAEAAAAGPTFLEQLLPFAIIFFVVYFLVLRPQTRKAKEHHVFLSALEKGDKVLTSSGILGTIEGVTEKFVDLKIAENTRVKILKQQVNAKANEA